MGGASKILLLLSTPFPLFYHRPSALALRLAHRSRAAALSSLSTSSSNLNQNLTPHPPPPSSLHPKFRFASQAQASEWQGGGHGEVTSSSPLYKSSLPSSSYLHPWPEWTKLLHNLSSGGYYSPTKDSVAATKGALDNEDDDSFAVYEGLQDDFVRGVDACLAFARDRPDALRLLNRKCVEVVVNDGSPFLFKNGANSAKRMKLFLSSDENNVTESGRAQTLDVMRYLLSYAYQSLTSSRGISYNEMGIVESSVRSLLTEFVNISEPIQVSRPTESTIRQVPVSQEQFSKPPGRNIEMKRGDWICTKCSFMNFARNTRCFECEEPRPRRQLTGREWECPQCEFFNYGRNVSCLRCDCKRPEQITSSPSGQSSTIVDQILTGRNTGRPELERKVAAKEERRVASFQSGVSAGTTGLGRPDESSINRSLDRIFGRTPSQQTDGEANSGVESRLGQSIAKSDPGYVPFVPLPPDMFSNKPQNTPSGIVPDIDGDDPAPIRNTDFLSESSVLDSNRKDESSDASERWSKTRKAAELDNVTGLGSEMRDEDDFPEIMPMRKGENRFVVSKKKDRSLTSPQYKRRLAMEQANKSDFVPFVPFPPDYFAKKDKQHTEEAPPAAVSNEQVQAAPERLENKIDSSSWASIGNESQQPAYKADHRPEIKSYYSQTDDRHFTESSNLNARGVDDYSNSNQSWNSGISQTSNKSNSTRTWGSNTNNNTNNKQTEGWKQGGFTGKSLEGSAVTEPDPLDMSEEAKAARWFRRAAQIKDISELSLIPDEDFPEIMPMRKGVNRFVVSKRKTPLERRLTSAQYRKNLPIVSSEPEKDGS